MRFSDMMGSGDDRSAGSETDIAVADALAPYLDAAEPDAPVETPEVAEPIDVADFTASVESAERTETVTPLIAEAIPAATYTPPTLPPIPTFEPAEAIPPIASGESLAARYADFTPLSDDLLPRKR